MKRLQVPVAATAYFGMSNRIASTVEFAWGSTFMRNANSSMMMKGRRYGVIECDPQVRKGIEKTVSHYMGIHHWLQQSSYVQDSSNVLDID
ncbi:hypothetical protein Q3G72_006511 [Acer saccharum]|nr:hypothetical protein Q3G72_002264 [Acer saccharum]KAK1581494.1 hypothetical protein Q3G72_006511 [Acer saccharum]